MRALWFVQLFFIYEIFPTSITILFKDRDLKKRLA